MDPKRPNAPLFPLVGPGGTIGFECPACRRPVWVNSKDTAGLVVCESCSATVRVPDPATGEPAQVVSHERALRTDELRDQTVLPPKRNEEDAPVGRSQGDRSRRDDDGAVQPPPSSLLTPEDEGREFTLRPDLAGPGARRPGGGASAATAAGPAADPRPEADAPDASDAGAETGRDPDRHRLNPNKNAKLVALDELAAEGAEQPEWRMGALERERGDATVAKTWKGRNLIWFGAVLVAAVVAAIAFFGLHTTPNAAEPEVAKRDAARALAERNQSLIDSINGFLAAGSVDERLAFVRDPERIRPHMVEYENQNPQGKDLSIVGNPVTITDFTRGEKRFSGIIVDLDDFSRRGAIFEEIGDGWKLDWESFVGFSEMDWGEFLSSAPDEPTLFRVIVSKDTYFNFGYTDSEKLACFQFEDVGRTASAWGYCEKNSQINHELNEALKTAARSRFDDCEAVVRLRFEPRGKGRKQVWIDEFIIEGHLVP